MMLGATRPTVSVVAATLQQAGLIKYHRGRASPCSIASAWRRRRAGVLRVSVQLLEAVTPAAPAGASRR